MSKIVFIGGGSSKFIREIVIDLFRFDEMKNSLITLMDVDLTRAEKSKQIVDKVISELGIEARSEITDDQRRALNGVDYVIITIMVGGFKHYHSDGAIPVKYGVLPTIGDTIGPGGVFRCVRTAPVLKKIAEDLQELAPSAWVLNYANPMAMNVLTLLECGHERTIGLCHSIQWCTGDFAKWLGIPKEEIHYTAGGINHVNFYLKLTYQGENLYPRLLANADKVIKEFPYEKVRFELLEYLGYFPAEGAYHQSEYYPWFRKNEKAAEHYGVETMWGCRVDSETNKERAEEIDDQISGKRPIDFSESIEYGAKLLHSLKTGTLRKFYGNLRNEGLISNLPVDAVVEVPCLADTDSFEPCRVGAIPTQLAAVMCPHIHVHQLAVRGVLEKNSDLIYKAIQADPLTGAMLTMPQVKEMTDELFEENKDYVQDWA
jgi:alpha-galactosidase